jgi:hypothetical protein
LCENLILISFKSINYPPPTYIYIHLIRAKIDAKIHSDYSEKFYYFCSDNKGISEVVLREVGLLVDGNLNFSISLNFFIIENE